MLPDGLRAAAGGLFAICVAAATGELLVRDEGAAMSLRALCALAAALCAARAIASL